LVFIFGLGDTDFFLKLHKEMFGDVWDWAGEIRTAELNFGVKAYLLQLNK
jgi:fido (protein-threonine AMPylation protein)